MANLKFVRCQIDLPFTMDFLLSSVTAFGVTGELPEVAVLNRMCPWPARIGFAVRKQKKCQHKLWLSSTGNPAIPYRFGPAVPVGPDSSGARPLWCDPPRTGNACDRALHLPWPPSRPSPGPWPAPSLSSDVSPAWAIHSADRHCPAPAACAPWSAVPGCSRGRRSSASGLGSHRRPRFPPSWWTSWCGPGILGDCGSIRSDMGRWGVKMGHQTWRSCTKSFRRACRVWSSLATVSSSPLRSLRACSRRSFVSL